MREIEFIVQQIAYRLMIANRTSKNH